MLPTATFRRSWSACVARRVLVAQALLFCILTATCRRHAGRVEERGPPRDADVEDSGGRIREGNNHFVPASDQAMEIVNARWDLPGEHVFRLGGRPAAQRDRPERQALQAGNRAGSTSRARPPLSAPTGC